MSDAGVATCLAYCAEALDLEECRVGADAAITRSIDRLSMHNASPSLFTGFVGVAWALHCCQPVSQDDAGETFGEIDDALEAYLQRPGSIPYDLVDGIVGIGVFALSRTDPRAKHLTELAIDRLLNDVVELEQGVAWRTPDELFTQELRERFPAGRYNLGMAHGLSGAIAFLARALKREIRSEAISPTLRRAGDFLVAHQQATGGFARSVIPGDSSGHVEISWCWGVPGTGTALLAAGRALQLDTWEQAATQAMMGIAGMPDITDYFRDGSVCHGAAGFGHVLNRYSQQVNSLEIADVARRWIRRVGETARSATGLAGYEFVIAGPNDTLTVASAPGLLIGTAGVAAALAAACSDLPPKWDTPLLLGA
jgi:lantibiotic modifying enzyme